MKNFKSNIWIIVFVLSFSLIVGCSNTDGPLASNETSSPESGTFLKASGPSASGQGRIAGTDRVFAFNAKTRPDGSVSGQGQLTYTHNGNSVKIHFMINCLSVSGNVATMSGTVVHSNVFQAGGPCWFRVVDNGEGTNAPADAMTGFLLCEPDDPDPDCALLTCGEDLENAAGGLNPVENGNIQVKP